MSAMVVEEDEEWREGWELLTENRFLDADTKGHPAPEACGCAKRGLCCDDDACINFSTQTECSRSLCGPNCKNMRFQKKQWADIKIKRAPGKGYGLFANQDIEKGAFVAEYIGDIISEKSVKERFKKQKHERHLFMQTISPGVYLDGQEAGSIVRFINHSCEPNAMHDRWVVNGKMCIGVFAMKDILKGEELCFDYRWEYNMRRPTRCHCGTPSCRGFLEMLTDEQKRLYEIRHGQWKKGIDVLAAAGDMDVTQWLIGKRIKVFWKGNSKYWECDVESYDDKEKKHCCYYIADAQRCKEKLLDNYATDEGEAAWMWLDEDAQEITIHRKAREDEMEGLTIVDKDVDEDKSALSKTVSYADSSSKSNMAFGAQATIKVRLNFDVDLSTARYIVTKGSEKALDGPAKIWKRFAELMTEVYPDVKCLLPLDIDGSNIRVTLFGPEEMAKRASDTIESSVQDRKQEGLSRVQQQVKELSEKQGVMLTNDWRISLESSDGDSQATNHGDQANALESRSLHRVQRACERSDIRSLSLSCPQNKLLAIAKATAVSEDRKHVDIRISNAVQQSLLEGLVKLGKKLDQPPLLTVHALTLLLRFLHFSRRGDEAVRDSSSLLAACMLLAQKARNAFKPKKIRDLVASAYSVVFKRTEVDPEFSTPAIMEMVVAMEASVLSALRHDVFVPDVISLTLIHWYEISGKSSDKDADDFDEEQLRNSFNDALGAQKRDIGHLAVLVARFMPSLWLAMPIDTALIACLIAERVCLYIHRDPTKERPPSLLLALWRTATFGMHVPYRQLMFFISEICSAMGAIQQSEVPSYLKDAKGTDGKESSSELWAALLTIVPDTLHRWFKGDQLLRVTLDDRDMTFPQGTPFRTRLPSLPTAETGPEWTLQFQTVDDRRCGDTQPVTKEMFLAAVDAQCLKQGNVAHVRSQLGPHGPTNSVGISSPGTASVSGEGCAVRRWPGRKQLLKESKWARGVGIVHLGVSPSALKELCMMQQVHYYSPLLRRQEEWARRLGEIDERDTKSGANIKNSTYCPYVAVVMGVCTVSGEFAFPRISRKKLEGTDRSAKGAHSHRSSDIAQTPRERLDAPPLKAPRVEATDADAYEEGEEDNDNEEESDIDDILDMLGGDKEKDSVSTTRPPQSFLVMPRVTVALESLLPHIQHASKLGAPWLASSLALCLCHDVLAAVSYLTDSGYYLKWLSLDQFFINSEGRLQLCGLQGAVAVREESETMLALRSVEKTTPVKPGSGGSGGSGNRSTGHSNGKEKRLSSSGDKFRDRERRKSEDHADRKRRRESEGGGKADALPIPTLPCIHMSAPEIILGGSASSKSGIFSAGIVCSYILAGKSPIKKGSNESKYVQYIYRTLGTPNKEGYKTFSKLPLASKYGRYIIQEGKDPAESRSRVIKVLREIIPAYLLRDLSISEARDEGDDGHVLDLVCRSTKLAPRGRASVSELLTLPLFAKNKSKLSEPERKANLLALMAKLK